MPRSPARTANIQTGTCLCLSHVRHGLSSIQLHAPLTAIQKQSGFIWWLTLIYFWIISLIFVLLNWVSRLHSWMVSVEKSDMIQSLKRLFYFESWPAFLCGSCVRLSVQLYVASVKNIQLSRAWRAASGTSTAMSTAATIRFGVSAAAKMRRCSLIMLWRSLSSSSWTCYIVKNAGESSLFFFHSLYLWSQCHANTSVDCFIALFFFKVWWWNKTEKL